MFTFEISLVFLVAIEDEVQVVVWVSGERGGRSGMRLIDSSAVVATHCHEEAQRGDVDQTKFHWTGEVVQLNRKKRVSSQKGL